MTGLECEHKFCTHCWCEYLTTKIMEEGVGQTIACAAYGCDILVDDATVMKLVKDSKVKLKYQHLITNSFVEVSLSKSKNGIRNYFIHYVSLFLIIKTSIRRKNKHKLT
jgi:deoxycytidylate deaminase